MIRLLKDIEITEDVLRDMEHLEETGSLKVGSSLDRFIYKNNIGTGITTARSLNLQFGMFEIYRELALRWIEQGFEP